MLTGTDRIVIARGRTAEVLAWQDGQVLKLFYDWMPADGVERELRAARLVSTLDVPAPKLLGERTLDGRRGLIYERVEGVSLLTSLGAHPWLAVQYARRFAELHAAVHRQPGKGLPTVRWELEATIRRLKEAPAWLQDAALERLAHLPDGEALCHLDFHPDQVLLTTNGLVLIDWMTARTGAPAADVARTVLMTRFGPVPDASWTMQQLVNLLRGTFLRAYLKRYQELNPSVTAEEVEAWMGPLALARTAENIPGERARLEKFLREAFRQPGAEKQVK